MHGTRQSSPFLYKVRAAVRVRHYCIRTERAWLDRIRRFILFHGKRHPREMGAPGIEAFLSDLATQERVTASTRHQARETAVALAGRTDAGGGARGAGAAGWARWHWGPGPSDRAAGFGAAWLPHALARKYPNAAMEIGWEYVFVAGRRSTDPRSGHVRRHPIDGKSLQRAVRDAVRAAGIG